MITPEQCRAGRALLDWSQGDLAQRAGVADSTIRGFEKGQKNPNQQNIIAIRRALEEAGVEFTAERLSHGAGVRFRDTSLEKGYEVFSILIIDDEVSEEFRIECAEFPELNRKCETEDDAEDIVRRWLASKKFPALMCEPQGIKFPVVRVSHCTLSEQWGDYISLLDSGEEESAPRKALKTPKT